MFRPYSNQGAVRLKNRDGLPYAGVKPCHNSAKQPRIFVVDDEPIIASTLAAILRIGGFDSTPFDQPMEALQAARSSAPDLLISDVVMPCVSGVELARQFKQCCPNCKVLLLSGQVANCDLLEEARAEGHDFQLLLKPMHPADLLKNIRLAIQSAPAQ